MKTKKFAQTSLATRYHRPLIVQTLNSVRSRSLSLKYQRFASSPYKDIGITKFEFVTKTQFLCATSDFYFSQKNYEFAVVYQN